MQKKYELLEHTADIAVRVRGGDLEDLFRNAALAMFDIMAGSIVYKRDLEIEEFLIQQKGSDLEELFVNWLNELLYLSQTKEKVFCEFVFKKLNRYTLEALVSGRDIKDYNIDTEIKAATYHELEIRKTDSFWEATVIFDV